MKEIGRPDGLHDAHDAGSWGLLGTNTGALPARMFLQEMGFQAAITAKGETHIWRRESMKGTRHYYQAGQVRANPSISAATNLAKDLRYMHSRS